MTRIPEHEHSLKSTSGPPSEVLAASAGLPLAINRNRSTRRRNFQCAQAVIAVSLKADTPARSGAVDPDCTLFYMDAKGNPGGGAHISTFLYKKHNIRAVKINAKIQCRRVSMHVILRVTLWKTGAIFPHKQAGPTQATAAKSNQLKNQMTWRQCKNTTKSTFYGTASGSVVFQGVTYSNSLQSKNATLDCGT
jgi:hypothetical protein